MGTPSVQVISHPETMPVLPIPIENPHYSDPLERKNSIHRQRGAEKMIPKLAQQDVEIVCNATDGAATN